jgi:phage-related protein
MRRELAVGERPLHWVGASRRGLLRLPAPVVRQIGWALGIAQFGGKHPAAKAWKGVGPRVLEVCVSFDGNAYRAVYSLQFEPAVYVLHCFQKKSPSGVRTARPDVELVTRRLVAARADWELRYGS